MTAIKLLFLLIHSTNAAPVVAPIAITCDSTCPKVIRDALPIQVSNLKSNLVSNCFRDGFINQETILETQGLTAIEIVDKLSKTPVTIRLSVYSVPWYKKAFHPECGFENGDGAIHLKQSCYDVMTNTKRESFYLHEISHSLGFTHNTAGNKASGNENTVPYSANRIYEGCFK